MNLDLSAQKYKRLFIGNFNADNIKDTVFRDVQRGTMLPACIKWGADSTDTRLRGRTTYFIYDTVIQKGSVSCMKMNQDSYDDIKLNLIARQNDTSEVLYKDIIIFGQNQLTNLDTVFIPFIDMQKMQKMPWAYYQMEYGIDYKPISNITCSNKRIAKYDKLDFSINNYEKKQEISQWLDNIVLNITPNPIANEMLINISGLVNKQCLLEIYNSLGFKVYTLAINSNESIYNSTVDASQWNNGSYYALLTHNSNILLTKKIIVNK